jgi:peptidoglycan/LPS O-acetylase OafA/YrhL
MGRAGARLEGLSPSMSSLGTPVPPSELGPASSATTVAPGSEVSANPDKARPPLDRDFRPDVEGLRAVAVATVVLFHAGVPGFSGGYVGVDIFFVISGFVITKLLLRQVERHSRPLFSEFYARRARRILPAAGVVVLGTLLASYALLGFIRGNEVADDSRWVAVFLGNYHFGAVGTNYFQSQLPPSPLQNYWSLAVEEQFYIVYPALIAVTVFVLRRYSVRAKLTVLTVAIVAASLAWSIYYTSADPTGAYFAATTRAWELALGGLLAAGAMWFSRLPSAVYPVAGWAGIGAIVASVGWFSTTTAYPGWLALLPVGGAGLVILAGYRLSPAGPERALGTRGLRWVGKLSFSIYLWHWPLLELATQDAAHPLSLPRRLGLVALSVAGAAMTFAILENPVRKSRWLAGHKVASLTMGACIVAAMFGAAVLEVHLHPGLL